MALEQITTVAKLFWPFYLLMAGVIIFYFKDRNALKKDFKLDIEKLEMDFGKKIIIINNDVKDFDSKINSVDKNSVASTEVQRMIQNSISPMVKAQETMTATMEKLNDTLLLFMQKTIETNSANSAKIDSIEHRINKD